jgi:hypothetical protein
MRIRVLPRIIALAALCCLSLHAWNGQQATGFGLRVSIAEIPDVAEPTKPTTVVVKLENLTKDELKGELSLRDLVDGWRVTAPLDPLVAPLFATRKFQLAVGAKAEFEFQIVAERPVYAALYPVHVYATLGKDEIVHAVRIFRLKKAIPKEEAKAAPTEIPVLRLAADGALALWQGPDWQVGWKYYDGDVVEEPVRWQGSDQQSRAHVSLRGVTRGEARPAINMHPPWMPGGGTVWCDYRVELPAQGPIHFRVGTAIRDHNPATEPGSDGVSFRVYAFEQTVPAKPLYEHFSDAKVWEDADVDLSVFAGKTITLRLEADPGPNKNTSCDSCHWGRPLLVAGTALDSLEQKPLTVPEEQAKLVLAVAKGEEKADDRQTFRLEGAVGGPHAVGVFPGEKGLLDGWFLFANGDEVTGFSGLRVDLEDQSIGTPFSSLRCRKVEAERRWGRMQYRHLLTGQDGDSELVVELRTDGPGLRVDVSCDRRISLLGANAWDQPARKVYWGHGYVIDQPQSFRASFGGHSLASSHVAFETGKGLAVLMASANPPKYLSVDPSASAQSIYTSMNGTLTFVPARGGMNAAIAYRPLYDKKPAGGVKRLAGRFCFDIWGGTANSIAARMREAVRYGLTDSFLTIHNWQRWGYDYRLPDIWPPRPTFGSVGELRAVGEICRDEDIPWGLHDNYIDFYPDAKGYTYGDIYFTRDGRPHQAWHNKGREAYSYKWRPDRILPFVERNFRLVKAGVAPTHCFLDVFTSTGCVEWWDWDGTFHSSLETRKYWGETFAWIRNYLGGNAPTTSEAGHDQLTGYLDGADCQWLTLDATGRKFVIGLKCGDWERVPWGSAVTHTRFIQHGVGYSSRYQGGRSREVHGINSDDYMSMEALSGHALMTDAGSWGRAAVRKYYLLQDLARRLARRDIVSCDFVEGDIHRQRVLWDEGTEVFVNRGESDWLVEGHVLPQYGFLARNGDWFVAVEKKRHAFAESSCGESGWFCDARTMGLSNARRVFAKPHVENFRDNGDSSFSYDCVWQVSKAHRLPWRVFVHFVADKDGEDIAFQDDHDPSVPTARWNPGQVRTSRRVEVPAKASGRYYFTVGLYSKELGRARLDGEAFGGDRILVGELNVKRDANGVAAITFTPAKGSGQPELPSTNPQGTVIDFGFAKTSGAFRVEPLPPGLRLIPLPQSAGFPVVLRLNKLVKGKIPKVLFVRAIPLAADDKPADIPFKQVGDEVGFKHDPNYFAYEIRW